MADLNAPIEQLTFEQIRKRKIERWAALETERAPWFTHWQDLSRLLMPRSGRYFPTNTNRAGKHLYNEILDSTPTLAVRILGAGLMAGATSPARPWFKLKTADPDLNAFHPVKLWLDEAATRMLSVFAKSNTYRQLHTMYEELGTFGTSVSVVLGSRDADQVVHQFPSPIGEFALALNFDGRVDTLFRKFQRSVGEVVREFGIDRVSVSTKKSYENNSLESPVEILHAIEPRRIRERDRKDFLNMPWESCYLETGGASGAREGFTGDRALLRVSGFKRFPVLAPRWTVTPGDTYGNSPGMAALGDVKQLNHEQMRKGQAIDYMTDPPKQVPSSLRDKDRELFPGGVSYYDQNTPHGGIRTAYEIQLEIQPLLLDIEDVRQRIRAMFYADLFLLLANTPPGARDVTATEVAARQEEKLLQLGPVLERIHNELLEPLIDITFARMFAAGMFPEPPPDLAGMELSIEFISILAQAQRQLGLNAIDRWTGSLLAVAGGGKPDVLDKFNSDAWADVSGERLGVDPRIIVPEDKVRAIREARNAAIAAQEQQAAIAQQAEIANTLAGSPTDGANALTDVVSTLG